MSNDSNYLLGSLNGIENISEKIMGYEMLLELIYAREIEQEGPQPSRWAVIPMYRKIHMLLEALYKHCKVGVTDGYKLYIDVINKESQYLRWINENKSRVGKKGLPDKWLDNERYYSKQKVLKEALSEEIIIEETESYKILIEEETLKKQYLMLYDERFRNGLLFPKYWSLIDAEQHRIEILKEACDKRIPIEKTKGYIAQKRLMRNIR